MLLSRTLKSLKPFGKLSFLKFSNARQNNKDTLNEGIDMAKQEMLEFGDDGDVSI